MQIGTDRNPYGFNRDASSNLVLLDEIYFALLSVRKRTKSPRLLLPRHDALLRSWLGNKLAKQAIKPQRGWKSIPASQRNSILSPTRQNHFPFSCGKVAVGRACSVARGRSG